LLIIATESASAQDRVAAAIDVYADDDRLTVVHPSATARVAAGEDTHVGARWDADVISSATIDVRTSASPRGFEETRHGLGASVEHAVSRTATAAASYAWSTSPDHTSHAAAVTISVEDDTRTNAWSVRVGAAADTIGRAGDDEAWGNATRVGATATWTSVISRSAVADLALSVEREAGDLESPYRFVPVLGPDEPQEVRVAEQVPDLRWRAAGRGRIRLALGDAWFARASLRAHADSFGITGFTADAEGSVQAPGGVRLALGARAYVQGAASFYRGTDAGLPDVPALRPLDRELARSLALAARARADLDLGVLLGAEVHVAGGADLAWQRFFDTPRLPERVALSVGASVVVLR
jgi:hypothetical protein